jgi:succinate dehydrogenase / fumarate reductase, cytochrome b subunit
VSNLRTTLTGYVGYRGREGQLAWLLHRITGLGVLLFLSIHIVDTATVYFRPDLYTEVLNIYRSTIFGLLEIALVFCLFYHGVNGTRIAYVDLFARRDWEIQPERRSARATLAISLILWAPAALWMLRNILFYNYHLFGG